MILIFVPKVPYMRLTTKTYIRKNMFLLLIFVYWITKMSLQANNSSHMTIAELIQITRKQKGISQTELAELSGVNKKSLSRYELGTSIPPANALKDLANALGVSADYLLDNDMVSVKDKDLLGQFEVIQEMTGDTKSMVKNFLDMVVRDFKAKQAYSK
jgi:transcriptional regulator with XRE-family HTH domain